MRVGGSWHVWTAWISTRQPGGEPERAKGADGIQLFVLDCIADNVYAETDRVLACMHGMSRLRLIIDTRPYVRSSIYGLMLMKVGCCNGAMLRST